MAGTPTYTMTVLGQTPIDVQSLPRTLTPPTFPDGSIDWRRLGVPINVYRTPEGGIQWGEQPGGGLQEFFTQYQTALLAGGAALLLLLVLGRRR